MTASIVYKGSTITKAYLGSTQLTKVYSNGNALALGIPAPDLNWRQQLYSNTTADIYTNNSTGGLSADQAGLLGNVTDKGHYVVTCGGSATTTIAYRLPELTGEGALLWFCPTSGSTNWTGSIDRSFDNASTYAGNTTWTSMSWTPYRPSDVSNTAANWNNRGQWMYIPAGAASWIRMQFVLTGASTLPVTPSLYDMNVAHPDIWLNAGMSITINGLLPNTFISEAQAEFPGCDPIIISGARSGANTNTYRAPQVQALLAAHPRAFGFIVDVGPNNFISSGTRPYVNNASSTSVAMDTQIKLLIDDIVATDVRPYFATPEYGDYAGTVYGDSNLVFPGNPVNGTTNQENGALPYNNNVVVPIFQSYNSLVTQTSWNATYGVPVLDAYTAFLEAKAYNLDYPGIGRCTVTATNATDGQYFRITTQLGSTTWTFRNTPSLANDVQIGATSQDTVNNLITALQGATDYHTTKYTWGNTALVIEYEGAADVNAAGSTVSTTWTSASVSQSNGGDGTHGGSSQLRAFYRKAMSHAYNGGAYPTTMFEDALTLNEGAGGTESWRKTRLQVELDAFPTAQNSSQTTARAALQARVTALSTSYAQPASVVLPTDIGVNAWFDFSNFEKATVGGQGGWVSSFTDSSGNAYVISQNTKNFPTRRPQWNYKTLSGRSYISLATGASVNELFCNTGALATLMDAQGDFTVCWMAAAARVGQSSPWGWGQSSNTRLGVRQSTVAGNYGMQVMIGNSGIFTESEPTSPLNKWFFYSLKRSGTSVTLKRNDVQTGSGTSSTVIGATPSDTFYIGNRAASPAVSWQSQLSQFMAWTRALSASEETDMYEFCQAAYPDAGLV